MEKARLNEEIEKTLLDKDDKIWNMQQSRTLDKIQRLEFVSSKKLEDLLGLLGGIDRHIKKHRESGITRQDAALYMQVLTLFTCDDVKMEKVREALEERWGNSKL
jgi:hypothetical protein